MMVPVKFPSAFLSIFPDFPILSFHLPFHLPPNYFVFYGYSFVYVFIKCVLLLYVFSSHSLLPQPLATTILHSLPVVPAALDSAGQCAHAVGISVIGLLSFDEVSMRFVHDGVCCIISLF